MWGPGIEKKVPNDKWNISGLSEGNTLTSIRNLDNTHLK